MARRWRLRNKLLLGLGLVLGCVGALIAGTAYGLSSYMGTMKTTDSKLAELLLLDELKPVAVAVLVEPTDVHPEAPRPRTALPEITPADGRPATPPGQAATGPGQGRVRQVQARSSRRRSAAAGTRTRTTTPNSSPPPSRRSPPWTRPSTSSPAPQASPVSKRLAADEAVVKQHQHLLKNIDDLRIEVASDMYNRISRARHDYNRAIGIVAGATAVALLLVATLRQPVLGVGVQADPRPAGRRPPGHRGGLHPADRRCSRVTSWKTWPSRSTG